jgi:hypothetical protein
MKREIFIAGIIQGSCRGKDICDQDYRKRLTTLLRNALPEAKVYCPFEEHPGSVDYHPDKARRVFFDLMKHAGQADILVAFLPQASLGTAIELWNAYQAKRIIFTISPMTENWVIKFLTGRNFTCLEEFERFVVAGEFKEFVERHEQRT